MEKKAKSELIDALGRIGMMLFYAKTGIGLCRTI
jgi:hypothetical protein